ncbi:MAG: HAD-IIB family hydrolase [Candidatus Doudnabacteria bacterium]|nr:HAD-IIB family hydrolase [Candidatus Doudnabacteria bacterium]
MRIRNLKKLPKKDLIVFDLDGTLVETKSIMDKQMSRLVKQLLFRKQVAVIGGGKYTLFQSLFLRQLKAPKKLFKNLFLFPTTSTSFYRYKNGWKKIYALELSKKEREKIKKAFKDVFAEAGYVAPKKTYGTVIEDRRTQITFSALGQEVVKVLGKKGVDLKKQWLIENKPMKMKLTRLLGKRLPSMEVRAAGFTSIDVTRRGIDKAYGMKQIKKHLKVPISRMLFVGDAIFPGGNDYAVVRTGVDYFSVSGPEETKKIIRKLIQKIKKEASVVVVSQDA